MISLEVLMKIIKVALICITLLVFVFGSNAWAATAQEDAVKAAESWLLLVDAGEYAKSWTEAAALFKNAVTKTQWNQSLEATRKPLGALLSRKVTSSQYATTLPGAPDGEYVVIQFKSSFANKKTAIETITPMKDPDGKWRVSGYFIK
jgi:hypothetical protein